MTLNLNQLSVKSLQDNLQQASAKSMLKQFNVVVKWKITLSHYK